MITARVMTTHRSYCHAINVDADEPRVFIHQNDCDFNLREVRKGDILEIGEVEETPRGPRACDVRWVERTPMETVVGTVTTVIKHRGMGFMRPDHSSTEVFLHVREFVDYNGEGSVTFASLAIGDRVRCDVWQAPRGPRGESIALSETRS